MNVTRTVSVLVVSILATVGGVTSAAAQGVASQGSDPQVSNSIGHGLVRIDSSWATVKTLTDGTRVLTFAKRASGQWMGEVGPDQKLMVRDINVNRLVRAWDRLGHDRQTGVSTTLTWNTGSHFAAITVSNPRVTPKGFLRFQLEPDAQAKPRMKNVTLNLSRALPRPAEIVAQSFPTSSKYALTSTGFITTTNSFALQASVSFSDSNIRCYIITLMQSAPTQSLPQNLACGSLTFTTGQLAMSLPKTSTNGSVLFTSNMLISGSPFAFNAIVATWTTTGN